ncbi:MAG: hypothetical protein OXF58_01405 [Gammaproteobacteria bacterium]|nr:hypothetical protein [Gammaproteobacteria bacterium]
MIRFLFAATGVFIVTSTLALADCNPNTEVEMKDRQIHSGWGAGTVDLLEGDVSLIIALRAKLCGNLKHINFLRGHNKGTNEAPFSDVKFWIQNVYGWSDAADGKGTADDKLVYSVRVAAGRQGTYKVNLLLRNERASGNVFRIRAPATNTSGTVAAGTRTAVQNSLRLNERRIPMTGTITLNAGVNEIEVQLTAITDAQVTHADNPPVRPDKEGVNSLSVLGIELIEESEYDALLKRAQTFPDMSWYTEKGTWGLFVHYSPCCTHTHASGTHKSGGTYTARTKISTNWEKFVEDFEVVPFVDKVEKMGASYVAWTIFHGIVYFPGPSDVLDSIISGRTATRDLIKDVGNELEKRGMRLLLYYHPGKDDDAWNRASGFYNTADKQIFNNNVIKLHTEWASRYNGTNGYPKLGSTGIYTDALWQGTIQRVFPFKKFVDAIKAPGRLPNAIIAISNQKVLPPTLFNDIVVDDYFGELFIPEPTIYDNRPGVTPSATMLGNAVGAVAQLQIAWFYSERAGGWELQDPNVSWDQRVNLFPDGQIVAFISYANGMGAPVFLNSVLSADVRAGVDFMSPKSITQMQNVTKMIGNNLRPHIADNSELNRLTYKGTWKHKYEPDSFNFTRSDTTANGASVEFAFEGPTIRVFANKNSSGGNVEVFIDNTSRGTVSTNANPEEHRMQIFEDTSLSAGPHTIRLVKRSGSQFGLDYFQTEILEQLCAVPVETVVDDADTTAITYSGTSDWTQATNRADALNKTISHTDQAGAYAEHSFNGHGIIFYTQKGPDSRKMKIYIDDTLVETDDGYSSSFQHGTEAYRNETLTSGPHKIKVECLAASENNPGVTSSSSFCHVDQFTVLSSN